MTQSDCFLFQKMWCQSRFEPLSYSLFTAMYRPCRWSVQCRMQAFMGYSTGWPGVLTVSRGQGSWWGRACTAPLCLCQPRTSTHWVLMYSVVLSWVRKKDKFERFDEQDNYKILSVFHLIHSLHLLITKNEWISVFLTVPHIWIV